MKQRTALIISILAVVSPICSMAIMLLIEPELVEAIVGGLFIGCIIGSVLGVFSLIMNKEKSELINIFSIIPMLSVGLYLFVLLNELLA